MSSDDKQPHKFSPRNCSLRGTLKNWRLCKHTVKIAKENFMLSFRVRGRVRDTDTKRGYYFSRIVAAIFKNLKFSMEIDLNLSYMILES